MISHNKQLMLTIVVSAGCAGMLVYILEYVGIKVPPDIAGMLGVLIGLIGSLIHACIVKQDIKHILSILCMLLCFLTGNLINMYFFDQKNNFFMNAKAILSKKSKT